MTTVIKPGQLAGTVTSRVKSHWSQLGQAHLTVGVHGDSEPYLRGQQGPATVAQIASFNEFGTRFIPERSFLRSTMQEQHNTLKRLVLGLAKKQQTAYRILSLVGIKLQSDIRQKINDPQEPPNAPDTIARKGSSNPLVDTGRLKGSITYKINAGSAEPGQEG